MSAGTGRMLGAAVAAIAVIATIAGVFSPAPARAQNDMHMQISPAELSSSRHVQLGLGKSLVIDLPRDAKDVLVSNPAVADAVMRTARRAYLIGVEAGNTNVFFFDGAGRQIAVLEVDVERDMGSLGRSLRQLIPGSNVRVEMLNDNVVLTGSVPTPADAVNAADIAGRFVGDPERVLNMLATEGSEQVHLKVTVAEVQRNILKQLGIRWDVARVAGDFADSIIGTAISFPLGTTVGPALLGNLAFDDGTTRVGAQIQALEQQGVLRVLAEPTLSAISGESAEFLAGGEFPVPTGYDRDTDTVSVEYKKFGVSLAFTPVVHTSGRIVLKVRTEVSELTNEALVNLGPIAIPGLSTRQADTTVELPSGGSLVLAGLLQQDNKQAINGVPGLKDIPILGALFRSRDYIQNETELVVIATPYLVSPVSRDQLARPDQNFSPADDPSAVFLGRLNKIYGVAGAAPRGAYHGHVGFIVE